MTSMLRNPVQRPRSGRGTAGLALLGAMLVLPVCTPGTTPLPAGIPAVDGEHVVRLTVEEARELAEALEAENAAEVVPGLELRLWASDPLVADPVALSFDDQGRLYYTSTERTASSEMEIRAHPGWMIESISFQTVEDRRRFLRRELAPERSAQNEWLRDFNEDGSRDWRDLAVQREHVIRLEDSSGQGRADVARRVASGFNTEVSDVALGVLAHRNEVFVTVAPDVWRIRDTSGNGVPDSKESISHGYGVHIGFGAHGLSGLRLGPDGRIYWAIGDLGLDVTDRDGRRWSYPNQGAILRANPDGSDFEVFAAGLRNPHEFDFDEFGNLIGVDNDGDHPGEKERLVYIVNGSDSGWRINWQFGKYTDPVNNAYKVWMDEGLWQPRFEGQAAYVLPPVASYHAGPSGMVYNPGTALGPEWRNHFFVSSFVGSPANTRLYAFRLNPSGAGFELASDTVVMQGLLATGINFGPDGALYLADWVAGWNPNGQGRIWKLDSPSEAGSAERAETKALIAADFTRRSERDVAALLRHADQRVRLKAQMELADRSASRTLLGVARQTDHQLARIHALWAIGQMARKDGRHAAALTAFLRDADAEVRAQAAKVIGDVRYAGAADALVPLLTDDAPRVRFFAAEALGRVEHRGAVRPLVAMLEANDDHDVYLRHAGSLALARIGDADAVVALADHRSRAVRTAAVVALRRMQHAGVVRFLNDHDEYIVTEAARAINDDDGIEAALPQLARMLEQDRMSGEALIRRAISANVRLGTPDAAQRLAAYAARNGAPEALRAEAVTALGVLPAPSTLDRVDGTHRGSVQRDPAVAQAALSPVLASLVNGAPTRVRAATAEAAGRVRLQAAEPSLVALVRRDAAPEVRIAALRALQAIGTPQMETVVRAALTDATPAVRMTAIGMIPTLPLQPAVAAELLTSVVGRGSVQEQQSAVQALGQLKSEPAHAALDGLLDRLERGNLPGEIHLEVAEAAEASGSAALGARLAQRRAQRAGTAPVLAFNDALLGGSAQRGERIAMRNPSGQCTRCHAFSETGPDVGPNLRSIGATLSREQLLESLVDPGARIAPGFGTVTLTLRSGEAVSGTLQEETAAHLLVGTRDGARRIATSQIAQRTNSPSAMPPMGHLLSRQELRDLVEYMTTLK